VPADVPAGTASPGAAAQDGDVITAALGETDELCRESASRISLELPGYQQELLEALHATGKPLVLVLSNGRALSVNWAAKHVDAIVELWFPGEEGGRALADVLLGDYNPAGRLPVTFPRSVGQLPLNFPARPGSQAQDYGQVTGPLFAFGHGLSYTTFSYANLRITPERPVGSPLAGASEARASALAYLEIPRSGPGSTNPATTVTVSCDVTNTGPLAGDEVVQLYLRDDYSSVVTFEQVLRGFTRVHLAPGETRTVTFALTHADLALYNRDQQWAVEPGRFTVMIGASSTDIRLRGHFTVTDSAGHAPEETPIIDASVDPR